jgi:hypothetical protein
MKCIHALESIERVNEGYRAMEEDSIRMLNTSFAKIYQKILDFSVNNEFTSPKLLRTQDELFQIIEKRSSILKEATPQLQNAIDLFQYIYGKANKLYQKAAMIEKNLTSKLCCYC